MSEDWQGRALAAERTVEVLKRKVKALYNGGGSVVQNAILRARARETELRNRQALTALRNEELMRHSAELEVQIAARTRDLQVILDNVTFGFLVMSREGTVRDGYSRSCTSLLERRRLTGQPLVEVLGFTDEQRTSFLLALELLFDDIVSEEQLLERLPSRVTSPGGHGLHLEVRVLRLPDRSIDGLLFTISDVTVLEAAQRENAHFRLLVQLLRQREAFAFFIADFRSVAEDGRAALASGDQSAARRALHTMKGNAGCFGLTRLAELAHTAEEAAVLEAAAFDGLEAELATFLADNTDVLQMESLDQSVIRIGAGELDQLANLTPGNGPVSAWIAHARHHPMRLILGPIDSLVSRLAERAGKQVTLLVEGGELRVDADVLAPLIREVGHLVRNAIDHGIELPEQRAGKPESGTLRISLSEGTAEYRLAIEDDGRGIDVHALAARACAAGLYQERDLAVRAPEDLLELVFAEGLSTAVATTDISGRGVGMPSVRSAVHRAGGTIQLRSELGRGTRIEIVVPRRAVSPGA